MASMAPLPQSVEKEGQGAGQSPPFELQARGAPTAREGTVIVGSHETDQQTEVGVHPELLRLRNDNAELAKRLQQERGMRQLYAKKLEEAEGEWLQQVEQLQAYVQSVRSALYENAEAALSYQSGLSSSSATTQQGSHRAPARPNWKGQRGALAARTNPVEHAQHIVCDLKDSFEVKTSVLQDDAAFIHEVREGISLAPEMDPDYELQELIKKFKIWKREFKEQLKNAAEQMKKKNKEQRSSSRQSKRRAVPERPESHGGDAGSDVESQTEFGGSKKKNGFMKRWLRRTTQYT